MARPRFQNLPAKRRSELLEFAANEFASHGYDGASLNRIIQETGLSKGSFYYYFDDKADLFSTVADFAMESILGDAALSFTEADPAAFLDTLDRDSFWPALTELAAQATRRMHDIPWLVGLGKMLYSPPPSTVGAIENAVGQLEERREVAYGWLHVVLEHGIRIGAVRDDLPLQLLESMVAGALEGGDRWFIDHWNELERGEREVQTDAITAAVKRMAESPTPAEPN